MLSRKKCMAMATLKNVTLCCISLGVTVGHANWRATPGVFPDTAQSLFCWINVNHTDTGRRTETHIVVHTNVVSVCLKDIPV